MTLRQARQQLRDMEEQLRGLEGSSYEDLETISKALGYAGICHEVQAMALQIRDLRTENRVLREILTKRA